MGGGIFGLAVALRYANSGHSVELFEGQNETMNAASRVNQARLHTGLHYPRDLATALTALETYSRFRRDFSGCVREIRQIYAVASERSRTSGEDFVRFADTLGIPYKQINPDQYLDPARIEIALEVMEGSFDTRMLKRELLRRVREAKSIDIRTSDPVQTISETASKVVVGAMSGVNCEFDLVVVCTYAHNKVFAGQLGIPWPRTTYQVCEVLLGRSSLRDVGITIMDGPFWSTMPYGWESKYSLTHVTHTPLLTATDTQLECQRLHPVCGRDLTADCELCVRRPNSRSLRVLEDFVAFTGGRVSFELTDSIYALKAVPHNPDSDARPTTVLNSAESRVALVFSGKVGDILNLQDLPAL